MLFSMLVVSIEIKPFNCSALEKDSFTCFSVNDIGISKVTLLLKNLALTLGL